MATIAQLLLKITGDDTDAQANLKQVAEKVDELGRKKVAATVDANVQAARDKLAEVAAKVSGLDNTTADPSVQLQAGGLQVQIDRVTARLQRLSDQPITPEVQLRTARAAADLQRLETKLQKLTATERKVPVSVDQDRVSQGLAQIARNIVGVVKQAATIAFAGFAAQAAGAGAAAGTALAAGLAPASGAITAFPVLLSAVAQAGAVVKGSLLGVSEALGGNKDAMKALSPEGRGLVKTLQGLKPELEGLQRASQRALFPGLLAGMKAAAKNIDVLRPIAAATGQALGGLARQAGALVGSPGFGRDLATVGGRNVMLIKTLGGAALSLVDALRQVVVAAGPFTQRLADAAAAAAKFVGAQAQAGRESGRLAAFLDRTFAVLSRIGSILVNLGTVFANVGKAASSLGSDMLTAFDGATAKLAELTGSAKGQNALAQYFADIKPAIFEFGRLITAAGAAFLDLARSPGLQGLIKAIRTDLLPAVHAVTKGTTEAFGPALVQTLTQLIRLFDSFAGSSGPLVLFVKALGQIAGGLATVIDTVPGLSTVLASLAGAAAISKALKFTSAATGLSSLVRGFDALRGAENGATAAAFRARAASIASAAGYRIQAAAIRVASFATGIYTTVTNASALAAARARIAQFATAAALGVQAAATGVATAATAAFGVALAIATSPVTLIVVALAALAAGLYLAYTRSETFREIVDTAFAAVKTIAELVFTAVKTYIETLWIAPIKLAITAVQEAAGLISTALTAIKDAAQTAFTAIRTIVTTAMAAVLGIITGAAGAARAAGAAVFNAVKEGISSVLGAVSSAATSVINGALNAVRAVIESATAAGAAVFNAVKNGISSVAGQVATAARSVAVGALEAVRALIENFANAGTALIGAVRGAIGDAAKSVADAAERVVRGAVGAIRELASAFASAGENLITSMISGIGRGFEKLFGFVKDKLKALRDLLPFSEPKDRGSPLRGLAKSGEAIMTNLADGIPTGASRLAAQIRSHLAALPLAANGTVGLTGALPASATAGATPGAPIVHVHFDDPTLKGLVRVEIEQDGRRSGATWKAGMAT